MTTEAVEISPDSIEAEDARHRRVEDSDLVDDGQQLIHWVMCDECGEDWPCKWERRRLRVAELEAAMAARDVEIGLLKAVAKAADDYLDAVEDPGGQLFFDLMDAVSTWQEHDQAVTEAAQPPDHAPTPLEDLPFLPDPRDAVAPDGLPFD